MTIEVGKKYILVIDVKGPKVLTFIAKIISIDDMFVTFLDKNNHTKNFNKQLIISHEEIQDD